MDNLAIREFKEKIRWHLRTKHMINATLAAHLQYTTINTTLRNPTKQHKV